MCRFVQNAKKTVNSVNKMGKIQKVHTEIQKKKRNKLCKMFKIEKLRLEYDKNVTKMFQKCKNMCFY